MSTTIKTLGITTGQLSRALRESAARHCAPSRFGTGWSYSYPRFANERGLSSVECNDYHAATQRHRASVVECAILALLGLEFEGHDAQKVQAVVSNCSPMQPRHQMALQALGYSFTCWSEVVKFKIIA